MDPLVHTRDQRTSETVNFTRRTFSKGAEDYLIVRKRDNQRFLKITRCDVYRLPRDGQNLAFGKKVLLHRDNAPPSPRPSWATNYCSLHARATSIYFQTWKSQLPNTNLCQLRRSWLPQRPTLQTSRKRIYQTGKRGSLAQVYQLKKRVCWKINRNFSNIFVFVLQGKYLSDHPRRTSDT